MIRNIEGNKSKLWNKMYNWSVGLYIFQVAVVANLVYCFPSLGWMRVPSFVFVACFFAITMVQRVLTCQFPVKCIVFYVVFLVMILSGMLYSESNIPYVKKIIFNGSFIKYVLLFSVVYVYEAEPNRRFQQFTVIAIFSLFVYWLISSRGLINDNFHYMTIGYGCAPWWLVLLQGSYYYKRKAQQIVCIVLTVFFGAFILYYGNRGALLLVMFALLLSPYIWLPIKRALLVSCLIFPICVLLLTKTEDVLEWIGIVAQFREGESRIITITNNLVGNSSVISTKELMYDSGRLPMWRKALKSISEHPFLGTGVGSDRVLIGTHVHNIVLELAMDFGIFIALFVFGWIILIGFRMYFLCKDADWKALFLPFYTFSVFQLMLSNTLWLSGYLVASIVIYLAYKSKKQKRVRSGE